MGAIWGRFGVGRAEAFPRAWGRGGVCCGCLPELGQAVFQQHPPFIPANVGIQERFSRACGLEAARRNKAHGLPWIPTFVGTSWERCVRVRSVRCALAGSRPSPCALRASGDRSPGTRALPASSGGFLLENVGLRLGQRFVCLVRVPITGLMFEAHPERRRDALSQSHERAQHRLQQKLDERRVA